MALDVKTVGTDEYGKWIKALIVGEPGSGKTRFSSTWPDALFLSAEGGLMSVADRGVRALEIKDTDTLREALKALDQAPDVQEKLLGIAPKTVVIDTFDEIARIFTTERNMEKTQEAFKRDDWNWFGTVLRGVARAFRNLPMNVVFTCHPKTVQDDDTGQTWQKPQIQGAFGDEFAGYVDLAAVLKSRNRTELEGGEKVVYVDRHLQTYPDPHNPWVKDRSGRLPMEFEINFNDDYDRLHGHIYGEIADAA